MVIKDRANRWCHCSGTHTSSSASRLAVRDNRRRVNCLHGTTGNKVLHRLNICFCSNANAFHQCSVSPVDASRPTLCTDVAATCSGWHAERNHFGQKWVAEIPRSAVHFATRRGGEQPIVRSRRATPGNRSALKAASAETRYTTRTNRVFDQSDDWGTFHFRQPNGFEISDRGTYRRCFCVQRSFISLNTRPQYIWPSLRLHSATGLF